ncbi:MAG TPA: ABC transporter permease subunit [Trebonia sp.]|jgi:NitT/TauT family transport system permease protein|nr:ABC transporter permease subunit [Trebonia sp.]
MPPDPRPGRRRPAGPRPRFLYPGLWLPFLVLLAVLGGAWTWAARTWPYLLPPLPKVWSSLAGHPGYYASNAGTTLGEAALGLAIGGGVAFALAVLTSEVAVARRAVMPVAVVLNVTPLVAIAPALVVAFGFGAVPKVVITALICFFPILINTATGLRSVPAAIVAVYRTVRASRLEILWHLRVPSALPFIFASLRIATPLTVIGAVVAEMAAAGGSGGLGTVIATASSGNQLPVVYAAMAVLAVMGVLLLLIVTLVERRALRWHESTRE